jgi:hypothetical protein
MPITKAHAEAMLTLVKAQFADYLAEGQEGPKLVRDWEAPSGRVMDWAISWDEDAPYEWTLHADTGTGTAGWALNEVQSVVFAEPYTEYVLGLYPND